MPISDIIDAVRMSLSVGPLSSRQLSETIGVSQPTMSRALMALGADIVRIGVARSIQYALRDAARGLPDIAVFRVDAEGRIDQLGVLIPVRPEGFVMQPEDGAAVHYDSLPWWLFDMRPQGYLGRAFVARHGAALGLPERLGDWTDTHVLRALISHGQDGVGNLLLGEMARDRFVSVPVPTPILDPQKAEAYARLAQEAARGELPGSSAAGEQPKFTAYAMTANGLNGPRQVIVKFSEAEASPVSERWRDLLLAEHLALEVLREADISAAQTQIIEHGGQRFLESVRFDRVGSLGRAALISLAALEAEFVGGGSMAWPLMVRRLVAERHINRAAADTVNLLWAFGVLIGNTDMHSGNLSFVHGQGRAYDIAPAYDMSPMAFAPRSGGGLPDTLFDATLHASVPNATWRRAEALAAVYLARMETATGFSPRFRPCIAALDQHLKRAGTKIARMA